MPARRIAAVTITVKFYSIGPTQKTITNSITLFKELFQKLDTRLKVVISLGLVLDIAKSFFQATQVGLTSFVVKNKPLRD